MIPKFREGDSDATGVCALVLAAMRNDEAAGAPSKRSKGKRFNVTARKRKLFEVTPKKKKEATPKKRKTGHVPVPVQTHASPIDTPQKTDDSLTATPLVTSHQTDDPITAGVVVQPPPAQENTTLLATPVVTGHQTDDPITPGVLHTRFSYVHTHTP